MNLAATLDLRSLPPMPGAHREASLIRQVLEGRRDLFGDLIEPHLDALCRVVKAKLRNDSDIEDIVQQTLLKAFIHLEQFRHEAGFRTWLIRIALNEAAQNWRRRLSSRLVLLDLPRIAETQAADPKDSPFDACARSQAVRLLQLSLASLPETYRVVVRMRDLEERSVSEVAEALRLTAAAVRTRHHRARPRMAKFLSETEGPRRANGDDQRR
jgi:RNA polymerase sigma-70 factor (ECF subfamily)